MAPRPSGTTVGLLTVLAYTAALGAASAAPCTGSDEQCGRRSQALARSEQALTKRGTGWGYTDPAVGADLAVLDVAWWYNWWGDCCGLSSINNSIPPDAQELLGFNEPNHGEESSLTPWYAASLWPKFEAAKRQRGGRLRLGSPAPAPCGAACTGPGDPIAWLTDFYSACNQMYGRDCETDFIATHLYTCNPQYLQWYLNDLVAKFKRPVWLTETACPNPGGALANQISYMRAALSIMDAMPSVERYAWFAPHADAFAWLGGGSAGSPSLLTPGGPPQLTALGRIYLGLATGSPVESLPGDAAEAMRAPLLPMSSSGSWSAVCGNCTGGPTALAALPAGAQPAFRQRCMDCGFGAGAAVWAGAHS